MKRQDFDLYVQLPVKNARRWTIMDDDFNLRVTNCSRLVRGDRRRRGMHSQYHNNRTVQYGASNSNRL